MNKKPKLKKAAEIIAFNLALIFLLSFITYLLFELSALLKSIN